MKAGDGFVAPVAAGYCAARRKADGSYDVAVSGVGAEALAWQEYRVGQDGVIERAALAVVENCDAERVVSAAAWANLAAAPAGAKRGQSDAVAAARACYAAALPFFASGRRPTHGGGFAPVLAPARQERANKAAVKQASRPNTVDAAAAALQNAVQSAGAAGALLQAQFGGSSGADKEEDASPGDDDDDDEDASGAAALLATMRFALEAKSPEDAFAAVVETRVTIACWGLAEAQKSSMDDRALKRALHAASRGLAAFATSEALAAEVLASVETASIALRDAADPPPVLAVVSGAAPVPTAFPLFDRFNEIVDEDALAGGAAAVSIVRPADLGAPAPAKTVREVLKCLRAVVDAGTLLANDRNDEKGRWLRISLVEHVSFRCLPAPAPIDAPHEACAWASGDATDADRVEVLRLACLVARQYASACLSPKAAPTRDGDANRVCCAGAMLYLVDAAARMCTLESGTGQDDAFCRRYAGKADRASAGYAAGAASAGGILEAITATSLLLDPAACAARAASLDYLRSLKTKPQIFAWSEAEPLSALGATDRRLVAEVAHELGFAADDNLLAAFLAGTECEIVDAAPALEAFRDAHLAWRLMLAPHLSDAVKPPPKKRLWRPAQLAPIWTAKKCQLSVKLRNGQDVDPAHLSKGAGFFGSAANMFTHFNPRVLQALETTQALLRNNAVLRGFTAENTARRRTTQDRKQLPAAKGSTTA